MNLKDLPPDMKPRERMLSQGAWTLCDAELLALILRTGTKGRTALTMADELLQRCGGLAGLLNADANDLKSIKGLGGNAKRSELLAVMELARRAMAQQLRQSDALTSPQLVKNYLQSHLASKTHEVFAALFLDAQNRLIAMEELFRGTLTHTSVYPREVVLRALHHKAASLVLAHNHPSGNVQPSYADESLTMTLRAALALIDVRVADHVIVAQGEALSMAEKGYL